MVNLISFRPNVASQNTAFEAMASIYKYLQRHFDYTFTVIKSESDNYQDQSLDVVSITKRVWQVNPYVPALQYKWFSHSSLRSRFAQSDGILTVDPTVYSQGSLAIQIAHQLGKPVWFDASRTDMGSVQGPSWKLKRRPMQKVFHQTTGIIVTVPKCIERFRNLGLFDAKIAAKFSIMGHPVDIERFIPQPKLSERDGILRVLVISRLIPEKGLFYILEAIRPLLKKHDNIQLQLLGSGPMQSLLKREVEEQDLSKKVIFTKPVSHEKIPYILGSADLFINHAVSLPQWEEFFGAVNIEAMACGLPCILSTSGGIPYAIREKDVALLIEERNIIQLREAITYLVDSKQARCDLGQRARDYVERYYALPTIAEKYHRMLQVGLSLQSQ